MKKGIISVIIMSVFVLSLAFVQTDAPGLVKAEKKQELAQAEKKSDKEILTFDKALEEKQEARKIAPVSFSAPQKQPVKEVKIASNSTSNRQVAASERQDQNQVSRGYSRTLTMVATGYTDAPEENYPYAGMPSYIGLPLARGIVAVDPNVIPMGTKLYIEGYGEAIAADQGGAIKGNRIDLFFDSKAEAYNWGMKTVKVYIR